MKSYKQLLVLIVLFLFISSSTIKAQESEGKSYEMVEITYIQPKIGSEKMLEKGIMEHNKIYHNDGLVKGHLDLILTGNEAGWYVWVMGSCMYTDLDDRQSEESHGYDWTSKISPHVKKYGRTELWRLNEDLSFSFNDTPPNYETVWFVDIKRGKTNEFIEFMEKMKVAYQKKGDSEYNVYFNQFNDNDGRDAAITWLFNHWINFDRNRDNLKSTYESIYGKGSWEKAMDKWYSITNHVQSQVWKIGMD